MMHVAPLNIGSAGLTSSARTSVSIYMDQLCNSDVTSLQEIPTSDNYAGETALSSMRCQRPERFDQNRKSSRQFSLGSSHFAPKVCCVAHIISSTFAHLRPRFGAAFSLERSMGCQTQKSLVLNHLRTRGSITTLIATKRYQCFRLSQRIIELERDGHLINHVPISRNGRRYMSYSLVEDKRKAA